MTLEYAKNHPEVKFGKTGVLIINLGTPDSTGWWDIRKYLKEFLSDRRVIEVNPILWKIILNLIILNFRPHKTAMPTSKSGLRRPTSLRCDIIPDNKHRNYRTNFVITMKFF